MTRHPGNDVVFVGTPRGLEAQVIPAAGFPIELIEVRGLKGEGCWRSLRSLLLLPRAFVAVDADPARAGGPTWWWAWAATPPARWCWRPGCMRIPTAVQEQNAVAGLTNRLLGRVVDAAFTAFPETGRLLPPGEGHPARQPHPPPAAGELHAPERRRTTPPGLLVFGGSQGAHALNMRVIEALPHLADLRGRLAHRPPDRRAATARRWCAATGPSASRPRCATSSTT